MVLNHLRLLLKKDRFLNCLRLSVVLGMVVTDSSNSGNGLTPCVPG